MKKVVYVAPETKLIKVELERGFMRASVVDQNDPSNGEIEAGNQEIEGNYDFTEENPWQ